MSDDELIRAFLAKKAITKVEEGVAFGVDPAIDQERRELAKAERRAKERAKYRWEYNSEDGEYIAEEYRERVTDAYMSGGASARDEEMAAGPNYRLRRDRVQYEDGPLTRRVKLNRY